MASATSLYIGIITMLCFTRCSIVYHPLSDVRSSLIIAGHSQRHNLVFSRKASPCSNRCFIIRPDPPSSANVKENWIFNWYTYWATTNSLLHGLPLVGIQSALPMPDTKPIFPLIQVVKDVCLCQRGKCGAQLRLDDLFYMPLWKPLWTSQEYPY